MKSQEQKTDALLHAIRDADEPTDEQVLRVQHSLMAKIAAGSVVAAGLEAATKTATAASSSGLAAKVSLAMLVKVSLSASVLGLGAFGAWRWTATREHRAASEPARIETRAEGAGAPEAVSPMTTAQPEPAVILPDDRHEPAVSPPARVGARPGTHQPAATGPELREEARLLAEVQQDLGAGRGAAALEKLKEYDQRFAAGVLRAEADAARVYALCQSGRRADAQAAAKRFLKRYPSSPSAKRVEQACAGEAP